VPGLDNVAARLADLARPGDLVITLGAGSIGGLATNLLDELKRRQA
jgi:UDP-N-acetylmuramate-alanine ligase